VTPNLDRFSGFADLYDEHRPSAPLRLGPLLARYAGAAHPAVVDLGSGTGLSTRWAATWAAAAVGIEPNPDMRAVATARAGTRDSYRDGTGNATGLPDNSADVVLAVQAMHWMEPDTTLGEVARVLRPGGVFAVVDADWPPVSGLVAAELAWTNVHRRIRVFEARVSRQETNDELHRPVVADDPAMVDEDLHDPHKNRAMPEGIRSWSKSQHLERMQRSGHFRFCRELLFDEPSEGSADRFVALLRSQGSYQGLIRRGLTDDDLGVTQFETSVRDAYAVPDAPSRLWFSWRVRLGCRAER
jgi:SAM-dependent methyltransferase